MSQDHDQGWHQWNIPLVAGLHLPDELWLVADVQPRLSVHRAPDEDANRVNRFRPSRERRAQKKAPEKPVSQGGKDTYFFGSDWTLCGSAIATSGVWKSS